jgi:hypothetical protein
MLPYRSWDVSGQDNKKNGAHPEHEDPVINLVHSNISTYYNFSDFSEKYKYIEKSPLLQGSI